MKKKKVKICVTCGKEFFESVTIDGKKYRLRHRIKCLDCSPFNEPPLTLKKLTCLCCGKEFERIQREEKGNFFCSKTCAATYNNKKHPKRAAKKPRQCSCCGIPILKKYTRCQDCREKMKETRKSKDIANDSQFFPILNRTLDFFAQKRKDSNRYAPVREHARKVTKHRVQKCEKCGYDLCVEVCHKKEISDFPMTALVSEVNHPDNLTLLCPNHHWEMDHLAGGETISTS